MRCPTGQFHFSAIGLRPPNMGCQSSTALASSPGGAGGDAAARYDGEKDHSKVAGREATPLRQALVRARGNDRRVDAEYEVDFRAGQLGRGGYATVRKAVHKETGRAFALKTIRLDGMDDAERAKVLNEVQLMRMLDHPNILNIVESFEQLNRLYIVLELVEGGELFDELHRRGGRLAEEDVRLVAAQLCSALKYCHDNNVCHRDIKLENVLLAKPGDVSRGLRLIDFGLAQAFKKDDRFNEVCGTAAYLAPEVVDKRVKYSCQSDMWSFGVLLFVLLAGTKPYGLVSDKTTMRLVKERKPPIFGPEWDTISVDARNFVTSLLHLKQQYRMSATDALQHPFLRWNAGPAAAASFPAPSASLSSHVAAPDEVRPRVGSASIESFKAFHKFGLFKKAALSAIAFSLGEDDVAEMRQTFKQLDTERNGVITRREFIEVMHARGVLLQDGEATKIFAGMDQDQTGVVKWNEFLAACMDEAMFLDERRVLDAFHRLDVDGTGALSKENLRVFLADIGEERFDRCFAAADLDRSGQITLREFRHLLQRCEVGPDQ